MRPAGTGADGATASLERLRTALAAGGLGLGVAGADDPAAEPAGPREAEAARPMPPRRRREFLAGRLAARRAFRAVGAECGEIPRAGRAPVFPPGSRASISHSAGLAVAVVSGERRAGPVGCDLELRPLPAAAARLVLDPTETAWTHAAGEAEAAARLLVLFSAKEAAWKAWQPSAAPERAGGTGGRAAGAPPVRGPRTLRALHARCHEHGVRVEDGGAALLVGVRPVAGGVFTWVVGPA